MLILVCPTHATPPPPQYLRLAHTRFFLFVLPMEKVEGRLKKLEVCAETYDTPFHPPTPLLTHRMRTPT